MRSELASGPTSPPARNPTIDGLKLVAAACIVLLHVSGVHGAGDGPGDWTPLTQYVTSVTYAALFFFFGVSGYLHGSLGTRGPAWLARRLARLGIPYLVWNLVYLAWETHRGTPALTLVQRTLLLAGAHEVLWSLPMLLFCALLAEAFIRTPSRRRGFLIVLGCAALLTSLAAPHAWQASPWRQFLFGARWPAVYLIGMEVRASRAVSFGRALRVATVCVALAVGLVGILDKSPYPFPLYGPIALIAYCTVTYLLLVGVHAGDSWFGASALSWGGRYLLGVYVSHYLWLEILVGRFPPAEFPALVWVPIAWTLVFAAAVITTAVLYSSKYTRPAVT